MDINLLDNYLNLPYVNPDQLMSFMKNVMLKSVTGVIGSQPFKFACAYNNNELFEQTFNKSPSVDLLKENAKGA